MINGSFTLQWHITHRCNLRCKHCYQDDYSAFSTRQALERVLDQYEAMLSACRFKGHINITGGEPLCHPDLYWLLEQAKLRGMTTGVLTNGTLLGVRDARRMRALGVNYVQVSLDGTQKAHDAIRGEGSFAQALEGIFALKSQGIFTDVSFTAQRGNLGELKKLAKLCGRYGVDKLWFDRVIIPKDEDAQRLTPGKEEYARLCRQAARLNQKDLVYCGRALQFLPCRDKQIYSCTAGRTLMALLADGTVMPCRRLAIAAGNINDTDLLTIYRESEVFRALRHAEIPQECRACEYAGMCRGGSKCAAYAQTGRFDVKDPGCFLVPSAK